MKLLGAIAPRDERTAGLGEEVTSRLLLRQASSAELLRARLAGPGHRHRGHAPVVALTADLALGAAGLTENEVATGDVMSLADARHAYQLFLGAGAAKIVYKP